MQPASRCSHPLGKRIVKPMAATLSQRASLTSFRPALARDLRPLHRQASTRRLWCQARRSDGRGSGLEPSKGASGGDDLIDSGFVPKGELLSTRLPREVRSRAEEAIAKKGGRVTIGDVAAAAGLTLRQAEDALRSLAADSLATLQVSSSGEVLYVFNPGFRDSLRARSLLLRLEPVAAALVQGAGFLVRISFGAALLASVVVVFLAISVALSSGSDDKNRRQGGRGGGMSYGGGSGISLNLGDIFWYWDPWYYRHRRQRMASREQQGGMGFLEAIFSFVFGDGDPNEDYDQRRWQLIGRYIQGRGGVVAAEELAPFLDVVPGQVGADRGKVAVDESYVLPVLARFGGEPQVDDAGNLLYSFPSLQETGGGGAPAVAAAAAASVSNPTLEQSWELSAASAGQKLGVVALGVANLVGVLVLTSMLNSPANAFALARNGLAWVVGALPLLQAYALSFFAIPGWRWFRNRVRNAAIAARNEARKQAAALVRRPDATLATKLRSAARLSQRRVLQDSDAVYRTDRDVTRQPVDLEGELFEERLRRRERERQG